MLTIHRLIIHELEKETDSPEANLFLSDECIPVEERAEYLVQRLNHTFSGKAEVLQGYLSAPDEALFPAHFQEMADAGFEESGFVHFSRESMQALQLSLQGVTGAKGGYLVYADYTDMKARMLGIFLVRNTEGVIFRRNESDNSFDLDAITYLNTDRLAMACRIHLDAGREGGYYAELIKHARSQKEISAYFIKWIALEQAESSRDLTSTFLDVVSQVPLPVDQETGQAMPEGEFREEVMKYALQSPQKMIEVEQFDKKFYGDQNTVQQYIQEHEVTLEPSFRFDDNTLRDFYRCRAYAQGIALTFNRGHYQNRQIEIEGDSVVIRSAELVEKVRQMLEE